MTARPAIPARALLAALAAAALAAAAPALGASPGQDAADRGAALYRSGDLVAARDAFREAVRLDPGLSSAWHDLGWVERRLGNEGEALRIWNRLLRLEPDRADTRRAVAELKAEQQRRAASPDAPAGSAPRHDDVAGVADPGRDPAALLAAAERALDAGDAVGVERSLSALFALPRPEEGWALRAAELFLRAGAVEQGIAAFEGAAVPDGVPGKPRALSGLLTARGDAAYAGGRLEDAAEAYRRAAALDGASRAALRGLGLALRKAGRLDDAANAWTRYARAFPGLAEPHELLSALHLDRRAFAEALAEARESLALDADSRVAQVREIRSLVGLTRYGEARALAAALAERDPDDLQSQRLYAETLTRGRDFAAAARRWRRVLDLQPESAIAKQRWVESLYESGETGAAVEAARAMASAPDAPAKVLELLADDARAREDLAGAARWYREIVRRHPDQVEDWRRLLQTLDALGRFVEQVAVAREAVARLPRRAELRLDLVTALANAGRIREAIARARALVDAFPDNRAAFEMLVDLLGESGDVSAALAALSRNRPAFYQGYEKAMVEARLRARRDDLPGAKRLLRTIAEADPTERFVPILLYHGVVAHDRTVQISARAFDEQMAALAAAGYHPVTLGALARMIDGEEPFPERPILITFDDARSDSFELGDPVLARHGFVATMFVPTALIGVDDAFHAGWQTMERYAADGRWELQAHGHEAHVPVTISADGDRGEFLAYRRWLASEQRAETADEFLARLERDYRTCREELERRTGRTVLGYAYPMNQVGYAQPEHRDALTAVNERMASRFFRFGMVQDRSGYNQVRAGAAAPFMLRRFEVPGTWSGEALLRHLARTEPRRVARLELARLTVDEGRPRAARRAVDELVREEPLVAPEAEAVLAHVAWEEQRPREAARHLAASVPPAPFTLPRQDALATRLAWSNAPTGGLDTSLSGDSDGRSVLDVGTTLRRPLADQLDVELGAGQLRLAEPGARALSGPQVRLGLSGAIGRELAVTGWARLRQLAGVAPGLNGSVSGRLRVEQHAFSLRWGYEDVDTVAAEHARIRRHDVTAGWAFDAPRWRVEGGASLYLFDDGNRRGDVHAAVLRRLGEEGRWSLGASLDAADSAFVAREYWGPERLTSVTSRARYRHEWSDASSLVLEAGAGVALDATHGTRPSGSGQLAWSQTWGRRRAFASALGVDGKALPGYRSLGVTLRLEGRF